MPRLVCTYKTFGGEMPPLGTLYHHPFTGNHDLDKALIFMSLGIIDHRIEDTVVCVRVRDEAGLAVGEVTSLTRYSTQNVCVLGVADD